MSVRLSVPYVSQLVGGQGGNNCGPAALAMTLAYRGVIAPTQEAMLEVADIARDGVSDDRGETGGYTTLSQLATVAEWYGQATWWPNTWALVDASVRAGEPVIILLDNRVLEPRQYPNDANWAANHFILLTSTDDARRYSSDPLSYYIGGPYFYTEASTEQGVHNVGGVQALALVPLVPPEPLPPEMVSAMSDWQLIHLVLQPLYEWAGLKDQFNPESGIVKAWVAALRAGHYPGRPRTGECPYGDPQEGVWQECDSALLIWKRDGTMSWTG